jgi:hypothetical protein
MRCKELDNGLSTFGGADDEPVAHGFDAKSYFSGAM